MKRGDVGAAAATVVPLQTGTPSTVLGTSKCFNDVTIVPVAVDSETGTHLVEVLLPSVLDHLQTGIDLSPHIPVGSSIVLLPVLLATSVSSANARHTSPCSGEDRTGSGLKSVHNTSVPATILPTNTGTLKSRYVYGPLVLDTTRHEVRLRDQEIVLTRKEFGLLEYLLRHPGRLRTREMVLNAVWGDDYYGTTRTVDVHIRRIRKKIPFLATAIICIPSLGYKLRDENRSWP